MYHELGHVLGGHLEIPTRTSPSGKPISEVPQAVNEPDDGELDHVLECDADAFACHTLSAVHTNSSVAESLSELLNSSDLKPQDFALFTYLAAIGILFRVLYPSAPVKISECRSSHPHPAVRSCLVASATMARGAFHGVFSVGLIEGIV